MSNPDKNPRPENRIPLHWMLEPRQLDPFSEVPVKNTIDNAINAMLVYLDDRVGAGPLRDRAQDKLQEAAFLATRAIVQGGVRPTPFPGQVSGLMVRSYEEEIRGLKAQLDTEIREAAALRERNRHLNEEVEALADQRDAMSKDMHDQVGIIRALQGQTDEYADFIRTLKTSIQELHDMMTGKTPSQPTSPSSGFVHPATVPITVRGKPWDVSREEVVRGGLEEALTEASRMREVEVIITDYPGGKTYGNAPHAGLSEATLREAVGSFTRRGSQGGSLWGAVDSPPIVADSPAYTTAHIKPE